MTKTNTKVTVKFFDFEVSAATEELAMIKLHKNWEQFFENKPTRKQMQEVLDYFGYEVIKY